MSEATITLKDSDETIALLGTRDQYLRQVRDVLQVRVLARNGHISLEGEPEQVARATQVFNHLRRLIEEHGAITPADVTTVLDSTQPGAQADSLPSTELVQGKRRVRPRTDGQSRYVKAIREHDLVLCIGPAGTGKTYLAVAMAISLLNEKRIQRILLCRPAVEAGEKLGFLPGDIAAKVDPYLRPLYDALHDMLEPERIEQLVERGTIEVAPLAFMRGRTLNDAFIILDEAQNTTPEQMKMFLTRIGLDSKAAVTGDVTQIDLPAQKTSGLVEAQEVVSGIPGIAIVHFDKTDVVRHPLVQRIVVAYAERNARIKEARVNEVAEERP